MGLTEHVTGWTLIGGVGQLFQGDLDLGRLAVEELSGLDLGPHVLVEELHYGAVAVAQRLEELAPLGLILVGAEAKGREPGSTQRRWVPRATIDAETAQQSIVDASTGYVGIDLIIDVAQAFEVLPARTVVVDVEPLAVSSGSPLSEPACRGLVAAVEMVRIEAARLPVLELADRLRRLLAKPRVRDTSHALDALDHLLLELRRLETDGAWGRSFTWRDRLRRAMGSGEVGTGMDHLDWGLWWTLIEAMDRLEMSEAQ